MPVIKSNMYILVSGKSALIIDAHINVEAKLFLQEKGVEECTIILTHEHFDHISGVNFFRELFACKVICTEECGKQIVNPRKSGSAYFTELFMMRTPEERKIISLFADAKYCCKADETYCNECKMKWKELNIVLKAAPGHSKGGQIIYVNDKYIFTGDSLIPNEEVILRLPGGSKIEYEQKVKPMLEMLSEDSIIYPGHNIVMCYKRMRK